MNHSFLNQAKDHVWIGVFYAESLCFGLKQQSNPTLFDYANLCANLKLFSYSFWKREHFSVRAQS